ncbi:MAG: hypothetical protein GC139_01250 [Sideroxydans sp.]|nr:hypothetical protein [Sideroxydans sp.]
MAAVIMSMSDYVIEHDAAMEKAYGPEVMNSGWNPALSLACQDSVSSRHARQVTMSPDLAAVDMEQFLGRMYAYLGYE